MLWTGSINGSSTEAKTERTKHSFFYRRHFRFYSPSVNCRIVSQNERSGNGKMNRSQSSFLVPQLRRLIEKHNFGNEASTFASVMLVHTSTPVLFYSKSILLKVLCNSISVVALEWTRLSWAVTCKLLALSKDLAICKSCHAISRTTFFART